MNTRNQRGDTALHGAAARRYRAVTDLLGSSGANLEPRTRRSDTPMKIADAETAEVLRQLGALE